MRLSCSQRARACWSCWSCALPPAARGGAVPVTARRAGDRPRTASARSTVAHRRDARPTCARCSPALPGRAAQRSAARVRHLRRQGQARFFVILNDDAQRVQRPRDERSRSRSRIARWRVGRPFQDARVLTRCECWGTQSDVLRRPANTSRSNFDRSCLDSDDSVHAFKALDGLLDPARDLEPRPRSARIETRSTVERRLATPIRGDGADARRAVSRLRPRRRRPRRLLTFSSFFLIIWRLSGPTKSTSSLPVR